jgi:hypothetical protein
MLALGRRQHIVPGRLSETAPQIAHMRMGTCRGQVNRHSPVAVVKMFSSRFSRVPFPGRAPTHRSAASARFRFRRPGMPRRWRHRARRPSTSASELWPGQVLERSGHCPDGWRSCPRWPTGPRHRPRPMLRDVNPADRNSPGISATLSQLLQFLARGVEFTEPGFGEDVDFPARSLAPA